MPTAVLLFSHVLLFAVFGPSFGPHSYGLTCVASEPRLQNLVVTASGVLAQLLISSDIPRRPTARNYLLESDALASAGIV